MTNKPAKTIGIQGRGEIKAGYYADICIFNPDTVIDKGTFIEPEQYPDGIEYVIINGEMAVNRGKYTANCPGAVLRAE